LLKTTSADLPRAINKGHGKFEILAKLSDKYLIHWDVLGELHQKLLKESYKGIAPETVTCTPTEKVRKGFNDSLIQVYPSCAWR